MSARNSVQNFSSYCYAISTMCRSSTRWCFFVGVIVVLVVLTQSNKAVGLDVGRYRQHLSMLLK